MLDATCFSTVIFDFSTELEYLKKAENITKSLLDLLSAGEILYESVWAAFIFRVNEKIIVKITDEILIRTEHQAFLYLQKHLPGFPFPFPHGLVRVGIFVLLFITFIPGLNLEKVWPRLNER